MSSIRLGACERLVVFGGGALALDLLKQTRDSGRDVAIVTSPRHAVEQVEGREFAELAQSEGIQCLTAEKLTDPAVPKVIGNPETCFAVSIGAAWIFKPNWIESNLRGLLFNLHGTRLPQNRGGGGFSWQILTGNRLGFCQMHLVDGGIDTGDIVATEEFVYPPQCRVPRDFESFYRQKVLAFMAGILDQAFEGSLELSCVTQSEYLSSYWPRLNTERQAWIDWGWPVWQIERFCCAFDEPYMGAGTLWDGKEVRLKSVQADYNDQQTHPYMAGLVYRSNGRWIHVACDGGSLIVEQVLSEGKNLVGEISVGDRLYTPTDKIQQLGDRVIYTPKGLKNS